MAIETRSRENSRTRADCAGGVARVCRTVRVKGSGAARSALGVPHREGLSGGSACSSSGTRPPVAGEPVYSERAGVAKTDRDTITDFRRELPELRRVTVNRDDVMKQLQGVISNRDGAGGSEVAIVGTVPPPTGGGNGAGDGNGERAVRSHPAGRLQGGHESVAQPRHHQAMVYYHEAALVPRNVEREHASRFS